MSDRTRRAICPILAIALIAIAYLTHTLSMPAPVAWGLAGLAAVYAIAGAFAPERLRWALLSGSFDDREPAIAGRCQAGSGRA